MKRVLVPFISLAMLAAASTTHAAGRVSLQSLQNQINDLSEQVSTLQTELSDLSESVPDLDNRNWFNMLTTSGFGTEVTNNTGADVPIAVVITTRGGNGEGQDITTLQMRPPTSGSYTTFAQVRVSTRFNDQGESLFAVVPAGYTYRIVSNNGRSNISVWQELR